MLIVFGTLGFRFLPGLFTGERLGWLDSLFTATSAVCVTGLIVVDTATYFTLWGQAFVLLLIQLGGLGMLTFTSLIILALGRRMSLRQEMLSRDSLEPVPHLDPRRVTLDIVRFTFLLELMGAVLLYVLWLPYFGWLGAIWHAIFHSVSAFCNAGFSTFPDSLERFHDSPGTLSVSMLLIVVGGLGFLTLEELFLRWQAVRERRVVHISLHSRLVLVTTLFLLVAGWIMYALFEWQGVLASFSWRDKLTNSLFMSVTARTAGFNTISYDQAADSTNYLTVLLMMVGGSPGSTAGGIKTTTFALIGLLAWSRLMGHSIPSIRNRSVRQETVDRAVGVVVIAFGLVTAGIFLLTTVEHFGGSDDCFLSYMFEAVSAFNTVGLSMGVTSDLSTPGRWIAILLMYFGRVGPLALAAALTVRRSGEKGFRYAYEDVIVG